MSEQKFYVKLKNCADEDYSFLTFYKNVENIDFSVKTEYSNTKTKFTKSELSEIMDGAFFKQVTKDELMNNDNLSFLDFEFNDENKLWEYTNPVVELKRI
ncbi:MAG: hypothetical protein WAX22_03005 [Lactococcus hircilactis]|uniref:hypothetical protein n=1 Tax=Lactococcus hircilactis TaxID=1494462 RepID=UPI003BDFAF1A